MQIPDSTSRVIHDIILERDYQRLKYEADNRRRSQGGWIVLVLKHLGRAAGEASKGSTTQALRGHLVRSATILVAAIESLDERESG